ncbi:MAG: putative Ig domain-containing protein [Gaiellaceae bacterium]
MAGAGGHRGSVPQRRLLVFAALVVLGGLLASSPSSVAPSAGAASEPLPRVTVFGDSVSYAIHGTTQALDVLEQGIDLQDEMTPCRRVGQDSCPYDGVRPANVIDRVKQLGSSLGETVIVAVGYNDYEDQYARNIADALAEMKAAGVKHVLWLTMHLAYHSFVSMNDDIWAAAATHPEMKVVDWADYSRGHPDWFQPDDLHLLGPGALAMATLMHSALVELGIPVMPAKAPPPPRLQIVTVRLRDAHVGRPYVSELQATGGKPPYRWRIVSGLPHGLHLVPAGRLTGVPKALPGNVVVRVKVEDAAGKSAARGLAMHVLRAKKGAK